jgi:hypothetical protein
MRLFTWTIVLYAALAMPMLEWMLLTVLCRSGPTCRRPELSLLDRKRAFR